MKQAGIAFFVFLLLLPAAITGCSPGRLDDPRALQTALQSPPGIALWDDDFSGLDAVLRPDSQHFGGIKLLFNAAYRKTGPNTAKFALFFPQGSKLGQCERNGREISCSSMPVPGASSLVRASFAAIDEIFRLSPAATDTYELVLEDRSVGIKSELPMLRRRHKTQGGNYYVLSDLEGRLLAAYRRGAAQRENSSDVNAWKAFFTDNQLEYRFVPQGRTPAVDVVITRCLKSNQKEHARNAEQGTLAPLDAKPD